MNDTTPKEQRLPLETIQPLKKYQVRLLGINPDVVEDYARAMEAGQEFPPLTVFRVGPDYVLVDGFHRHGAYLQRGTDTVACEVYDGTGEEAYTFAQFEANRKNGQRLSRADLRAVVTRLVTDKQYVNTPSTTLADLAGVSHSTVNRVREELGLKPCFVVTATGTERQVAKPEGELDWNEGEPPAGADTPEHGGFPVLTQKVALRLADRLGELEASLAKLEPLCEWLEADEAQMLAGLGERVVALAEEAL